MNRLETLKEKGAVFAKRTDGQHNFYRYGLYREVEWTLYQDWVLWIGLNPSTAGANDDDMTIAKMKGFTRRWECGAFAVVNLFAMVATDPDRMAATTDRLGPYNDAWISELAATGPSKIVACWGGMGGLDGRDLAISSEIPNLLCLGKTQKGFPRHPSRIAYDTELEPFTP